MKTNRPESGLMQFGDDWPGLFMRGDHAIPAGVLLEEVLKKVQRTGILDAMELAQLHGLCRDLMVADVAKGAAVQHLRPWESCVVLAEVKRQEELLAGHDRNTCDACAGSGTPTSGLSCMCGGSGRAEDAVRYLRAEVNRLTTECEHIASRIYGAEGEGQRAREYAGLLLTRVEQLTKELAAEKAKGERLHAAVIATLPPITPVQMQEGRVIDGPRLAMYRALAAYETGGAR